jgi:hypothetical protein
MEPKLLTRDQFRTGVFQRDGNMCVLCKMIGKDAHHITERRLFSDGGYYIENGATLCGLCHIKAEQTIISTEEIRKAAGITHIVLPDHAYPDQQYDKWLNPILPNGTRVRGELFEDLSVQKVLEPVLHLFTNRVKYSRTSHVPWSKGLTNDDRVLEENFLNLWNGVEIVITEKRDGEQSNLYNDGIHARSIDFSSHPSRDRLRALHSQIAHDIPDNWRITGENLTAMHSIHYKHLDTFFEVFGIWNGLECFSWQDTELYAGLLGLKTVPLLWRGVWNTEVKKSCIGNTLFINKSLDKIEGYVIRPAQKFQYKDFNKVVGKFVRANHVDSTKHHWFGSQLVWNEFDHK